MNNDNNNVELQSGEMFEENDEMSQKRTKQLLLCGLVLAAILAALIVGILATTCAGRLTPQSISGEMAPGASASSALRSISASVASVPAQDAHSTITLPDGSQAELNADGSATRTDGTVIPAEHVPATPNANPASKGGAGNSPAAQSDPNANKTWYAAWDEWVVDVPERYESQLISEAWDEPVYEVRPLCSTCGSDLSYLDNNAMYEQHIIPIHKGGGFYMGNVLVNTIHHEATYDQVWIPEQGHWVHHEGYWG